MVTLNDCIFKYFKINELTELLNKYEDMQHRFLMEATLEECGDPFLLNLNWKIERILDTIIWKAKENFA